MTTFVRINRDFSLTTNWDNTEQASKALEQLRATLREVDNMLLDARAELSAVIDRPKSSVRYVSSSLGKCFKVFPFLVRANDRLSEAIRIDQQLRSRNALRLNIEYEIRKARASLSVVQHTS